MASCEIIGTEYGARVTYTVTQDVAMNRSTVRVTKVEMKMLSSVEFSAYITGTISVNGVQATQMTMGGCYISQLNGEYKGGGESDWSGFSTNNTTVYHGEDGTAEISIKANITVNFTLGHDNTGTPIGSPISKTVKVSLPKIPRVSELSASPVELGKEMSIRITRAASGFKDTVTWSCGSESGNIAIRTSETSITWTPPVELANQAPNGTAAEITLKIYTFEDVNSTSQIGSRALTLRCGIPETLVPSLSVSVEDKMGYSQECGGYVQNQSQLNVKTNAAGTYGSTIRSIAVTCGRLTGTGSDICFALEDSGTIEISVTVTDSRGRTAAAATEITVLPYRKPAVTISEGYRCDASGNWKPDGEWMKLIFNSQVTALTGNTSAYFGSCTVHGGTEKRTVSLTDYQGQFNVTGGSFLISAGLDTAYDCKISVQDKFCTAESNLVLISVAFALLDMCRDTKAVGIGMRARTDGKLSIGMNTDMAEHTIENLANPVNPQDAATKAYVDWIYQVLLGMIQNSTGG